MQCIHFVPPADSIPGAGGECLLKTDYFHVYLRSAASGTAAAPAGRCAAWMMLDGAGCIQSDSADPVLPVAAGDTILFPAALGAAELTANEPARWLEVLLRPFGSMER